MSNKEFKKINESWDKFLTEELKELSEQDNEELKELFEQERLDEMIVTAATVAKVIYILSQKDNIIKVVDALLTREDLPDPARNILERVSVAVRTVDKELPAAARAAVELRGKAPDSWMGNILTSIFASQIKRPPQISTDEPAEGEIEEPSGEE
jgi:hypothetical protein